MQTLDFDFIRDVVDYFNSHESTVRKTAKVFGISKSTVYIYLTKKLPNSESKRILEKNKLERHLRGGAATKKKYLSLRS